MISLRAAVLASLAIAAPLVAQTPPGPPDAPRAGPAAKLLLANTGELELTDAQVVRLAAIARRAEARRRGLRAAMDSARARFGQPNVDTAARRQFRDRMRADMDRASEQQRLDQRDAIAVLTADQQARAWNLVASRGRGMGERRVGEGGMGMGGFGRGMRRGMHGGMRGMAPNRERRGDRPGFRAPDGRPDMPAPGRPPEQ